MQRTTEHKSDSSVSYSDLNTAIMAYNKIQATLSKTAREDIKQLIIFTTSLKHKQNLSTLELLTLTKILALLDPKSMVHSVIGALFNKLEFCIDLVKIKPEAVDLDIFQKILNMKDDKPSAEKLVKLFSYLFIYHRWEYNNSKFRKVVFEFPDQGTAIINMGFFKAQLFLKLILDNFNSEHVKHLGLALTRLSEKDRQLYNNIVYTNTKQSISSLDKSLNRNYSASLFTTNNCNFLVKHQKYACEIADLFILLHNSMLGHAWQELIETRMKSLIDESENNIGRLTAVLALLKENHLLSADHAKTVLDVCFALTSAEQIIKEACRSNERIKFFDASRLSENDFQQQITRGEEVTLVYP